MNASQTKVSRPMVGVLALLCLIAGVAIGFVPGATGEAGTSAKNTSGTGAATWQAAFVRVGLVMGAFWIALPARGRAAAWSGVNLSAIGAIVVAVLLVGKIRNPLVVVALIVVAVVAGLLLRPRGRDRPPR